MACNELADLLERSLEGGLTLDEKTCLDQHLETCAACRFRLASLKDLQSLYEGEEVPKTFSAAWREEIKTAKPAPVRQLPQATRWLAMAATLVLLLLGAYKAGDLDLLGIRSAAPEKSISAYTAAVEQETLPTEASPLELTAVTMMEPAKQMDVNLDMSEEADAARALQSAPEAGSEIEATVQENDKDETPFPSFLADKLIYLMPLIALILLILLINEKRKHK